MQNMKGTTCSTFQNMTAQARKFGIVDIMVLVAGRKARNTTIYLDNDVKFIYEIMVGLHEMSHI